jgi:hypothetical protein
LDEPDLNWCQLRKYQLPLHVELTRFSIDPKKNTKLGFIYPKEFFFQNFEHREIFKKKSLVEKKKSTRFLPKNNCVPLQKCTAMHRFLTFSERKKSPRKKFIAEFHFSYLNNGLSDLPQTWRAG